MTAPKTAWKPATAEEAQQDNERRLRVARKHFGYIPIRFQTQTRIHIDDRVVGRRAPAKKRHRGQWNGWGLIQGFTIKIRLSEAIDVFDLLRDVASFVQAWRPWRARSPENKAAAERALQSWKDLGK